MQYNHVKPWLDSEKIWDVVISSEAYVKRNKAFIMQYYTQFVWFCSFRKV